jgi:hypothetical protein
LNQTEAANIDGLLADANLTATDVNVGVTERRKDLRNGYAVGFQFVGIHFDLKFLGGALPNC